MTADQEQKAMKTLTMREKEREERRKREKNLTNIFRRELSLRRMTIPLISSPTVKRGRGESGRWTEELQRTPYPIEGANHEVTEIENDIIESEK